MALQPERCVSGQASFAVDNLTYSIRRYGKIPRQLVYADVHWFHEIVSQDFTRRRNRIKKIFAAHYCTSTIVDDFDAEGVAVMPFKTDSPLLVDVENLGDGKSQGAVILRTSPMLSLGQRRKF